MAATLANTKQIRQKSQVNTLFFLNYTVISAALSIYSTQVTILLNINMEQ